MSGSPYRFAHYRLNAAVAPTKRCNTFRRGHMKRRFILVAVVKRRFILRCYRGHWATGFDLLSILDSGLFDCHNLRYIFDFK